MKIQKRRYSMLTDFQKVYDFLTETYDQETLCSYLLPQYFEYAQYSQWLDWLRTHHFGLWEEEGRLVGIACYEMRLGTVHLHTRKGYEDLLPQLLEWAEQELSEVKRIMPEQELLEVKRIMPEQELSEVRRIKPEEQETGSGQVTKGERKASVVEVTTEIKCLHVWITDKEPDKRKLLIEQGYRLCHSEPVKVFYYDKPFPQRELPEGFRLIDGTEVDVKKLSDCWWAGFDHPEVPPAENQEGNLKMLSAPHSNHELMTIAVAPNGEYACALGMWYDEQHRYAYLEPLATPPRYRRLGLATICLSEAMRKTKELGATYCFGGGREFYTEIGFQQVCSRELWKKEWWMGNRILSVRENPEYAQRAIDYFSKKWGIDRVIYDNCITHCLTSKSPLPQWYLLLNEADCIIGAYGLIVNDFISRNDLWPWLCALYIEEEERGKELGSLLLKHGQSEARRLCYNHVYLCTDHVGYYEKYGWQYIGEGYHPWGESSRIYEIGV